MEIIKSDSETGATGASGEVFDVSYLFRGSIESRNE
jgi:hypothetical protein